MAKKAQAEVQEPETTIADAVAELTKRLSAVGEKLTALGIKTTVGSAQNEEETESIAVLLSLDSQRTSLELLIDEPEEPGPYDLAHLPEVTIIGKSAKHRQVVLQVREVARTLVRTVNYELKTPTVPTLAQWQHRFPVSLPATTKYSVDKVVTAQQQNETWLHTAQVTAKVPASDQHFLVGYDEKHLFISLLEKKVKSVAEAHEALLPKELRGARGRKVKHLRQGEYFFVPASKAELKAMTKYAEDDSVARFSVARFTDTNEYLKKPEAEDGNSDHVAQFMYDDGDEQLVTGAITHDRHATLFLNGWYRVVRNAEVPNPSDSTTWD